MENFKEVADDVRPIAQESLDTFEKIARSALQDIQKKRASGNTISIARNTFTDGAAVRSAGNTARRILEGNRSLKQEPAIARVVVADEDGQRTTYYFSRTYAASLPGEKAKFTTYHSKLGTLAEIEVGDEYTVMLGEREVSLEVLERAKFSPFLSDGKWDADNVVFQLENERFLSADSLRQLLSEYEDFNEDILDALIREESAAAGIREGIRRAVISKMGLRDQLILDRYQGEIFRMPLSARLLLLGAPGTGKTTTLIRRLAQKIDVEFLEGDEQQLVSRDHSQSWIMFTPTELLKLYVREAFNKEDIPAPDGRVHTWSEFRSHLARNEFKFLRSATLRSGFVMNASVGILLPNVESDQISFFNDFSGWQQKKFWDEIRIAAEGLLKGKKPETIALGERALQVLREARTPLDAGTLVSFTAISSEVSALVGELKKSSDEIIKRGLTEQLNRDKGLLDDIATFLTAQGTPSEDEDYDQELEDEEEGNQPPKGRAAARNAYMRAMRSLARSKARGGKLSPKSTMGRLVAWMGDRVLAEKELSVLGRSLLIQSSLRPLVNPATKYIEGIPSRYRQFRRIRQGEGHWYVPDGGSQTDITPIEVDILLLAMLKASNSVEALSSRLIENDPLSGRLIERMTRLYKNQVLVDEATDFSPIQLSCMANLCNPRIRSFFACGDFNQRVTNWGTRSAEEMRWVLPDFQIRTIDVGYRQSKKLHELAQHILSSTGTLTAEVKLPNFSENVGLSPVLIQSLNVPSDQAAWLADRITEIERFSGAMPSIAVLVNAENEIFELAAALEVALAPNNVTVQACPQGQVRGSDSAVRIFSVEHIKGLEFEAVFFVDVDELAEKEPDLFDKYLYVGATRAATYLGVTCRNLLPSKMIPLTPLFSENWL
ncbi:ATP-binding domain-containing protein [Thalassospira sp. NFXS8]|uniref:ATP-binding domain-containing protein n=1 Tax=Thalassospira sp. NFXS8 TaxID=2819093 RepID=UPI0032DF1D14